MYDILNKHGQTASFLIGGLISILALVFALNSPEFGPVDVDFSLYATYGLLAVATILAFVLPLIYLMMNPKEALSGLIGIGFLVVVLVIGYVLSSEGAVSDMTLEKFAIDGGTSKMIGTFIYSTYVLGALAIVAIVVSEIMNMFK